jgi:hypothetical protein
MPVLADVVLSGGGILSVLLWVFVILVVAWVIVQVVRRM